MLEISNLRTTGKEVQQLGQERNPLPLAGRVREGVGEAIDRRINKHENTPADYRRARELRNNASPVENILWPVLREAAKLVGLKFRRQQVIHPYIADFACMSVKLVVELDGDSHVQTVAYDRAREQALCGLGFTVLRFCNDDVVKNAEGVVVRIIEQALRLRTPLPNPPRKGEGIFSNCLVVEQSENA
jgi:very-short-patch-repair endonuclease